MGLSHPSPVRLRLLLLLQFLLGFIILGASAEQVVNHLPGYNGDLAFTLRTGYIGVDNDEVQLFYYYVESERAPEKDPVMLWINGGPGCSSLFSFFFENGPLTIDIEDDQQDPPRLIPNQYSWTKTQNVIFLDAPVGTGFSYATTTQAANASDTQFIQHLTEFTVKWYKLHPSLSANPFYISGEGYTAMPAPVVLQRLLNSTDEHGINVKGFVLGNPGTDKNIDFNSRVEAAHRLALIPDEIYEDAKAKCNGSYFPAPDNSSSPCGLAIQNINELTCQIDPTNSLNKFCETGCSQLIPSTVQPKPICPTSIQPSPDKECDAYVKNITETWANNLAVQEALHVEPGTVPSWTTCKDGNFDHDIPSVVSCYQDFIKNDVPLRGLFYSGDHDLSIPYVGTLQWINSLKWNVVDAWAPWCAQGQTGGYAREFGSGQFTLEFATIRGAGHFGARKKAECSTLVLEWMENGVEDSMAKSVYSS